MPAYVLTLRDRWIVAWTDRRVRRRVFRVIVFCVGGLVSTALGRLCVFLPVVLEPTCHLAAEGAGKVAKLFALAMGAG